MPERARSLEDARAKQIHSHSGVLKPRQHSADTQREVRSPRWSDAESAAYIRASAGGVTGKLRPLAREPAKNLRGFITLIADRWPGSDSNWSIGARSKKARPPELFPRF